MKLFMCTHGGGTNWGVPNNVLAIKNSLIKPRIDGVETDLAMSSDGVVFCCNPFIQSNPDSWGNKWLGLGTHPGNLSWNDLQQRSYDLDKVKSDLERINGSDRTVVEDVDENKRLFSLDHIQFNFNGKELHLHIEPPKVTNVESQIKDIGRFIKEWVKERPYLRGKIFIHSSSVEILNEFRGTDGVKLCIGIGKGRVETFTSLADGLKKEIGLISTSNETNFPTLASLRKDIRTAIMVYSPKTQSANIEQETLQRIYSQLQEGDYLLVNQGQSVKHYLSLFT